MTPSWCTMTCVFVWTREFPQIQWVIIISTLNDHLVSGPLFKPKFFQCWLLWSRWLRPEVASWCDVVATPCQDLGPGKGMEQGDSQEKASSHAFSIIRFRESFSFRPMLSCFPWPSPSETENPLRWGYVFHAFRGLMTPFGLLMVLQTLRPETTGQQLFWWRKNMTGAKLKSGWLGID